MPEEFVSEITRLAKNAVVAEAVIASECMKFYDLSHVHKHYSREPTVRPVPAHYFGPGVVAFTKPDEGEIAMPPIERVPYQNGVHSWQFVLAHERTHNYIHAAGGIQDERGINNHVAYKIGPKYGIDRFPFPSY